MSMKNPTSLVSGRPECFGNYEPDDYVCNQTCSYQMYCAVESRDEEKRVDYRAIKDENGRSKCFGELYSKHSYECNYTCGDAYDCEQMKELKEGRYRLYSPPTAKRSNSLNVIQPTRPSSPWSNQTTNITQSVPQRNIDPSTRDYVRRKYGVALDPDPVIPGQFEGEDWWIRLAKEVLKHAGYYALQLLSQVLLNTWWAPKMDTNESIRNGEG